MVVTNCLWMRILYKQYRRTITASRQTLALYNVSLTRLFLDLINTYLYHVTGVLSCLVHDRQNETIIQTTRVVVRTRDIIGSLSLSRVVISLVRRTHDP